MSILQSFRKKTNMVPLKYRSESLIPNLCYHSAACIKPLAFHAEFGSSLVPVKDIRGPFKF